MASSVNQGTAWTLAFIISFLLFTGIIAVVMETKEDHKVSTLVETEDSRSQKKESTKNAEKADENDSDVDEERVIKADDDSSQLSLSHKKKPQTGPTMVLMAPSIGQNSTLTMQPAA